MPMHSLENTKPKPSRSACEDVAEPDSASYPYGTRITLEAETIKKLGIQKLPTVGGQLVFKAKARVIGVSQSDDGKRIELQITDMDMDMGGGKDDTDRALTRDDSGPLSKLSKTIKEM